MDRLSKAVRTAQQLIRQGVDYWTAVRKAAVLHGIPDFNDVAREIIEVRKK